jgi:Fe-S-cluster containining protein
MSGCTRCGSCCKKYGMRLEASPLDIARWRLDERRDILCHVGIEYDGDTVSGGKLWVDEKGERVKECPFLRRDGKNYGCMIHDAEPEVCATHYCQNYF